MSISRMLNEFRPLFRMLEEPLIRSPSLFNNFPNRSLFEDPFSRAAFTRPAIDVTEEENKYILEADLPGIRKENVEVRIGDDGRSITIEGKLSSRQSSKPVVEDVTTEDTSTTQVTDKSNQKLTSERAYADSAHITRTVWLPRPVDTSNVVAKLQDGVLNVTVSKVEDKGSVTVPVL